MRLRLAPPPLRLLLRRLRVIGLRGGAILVGADRGVVDHERRVRRTATDLDACIHARDQRCIGIGKTGAHADRAGAAIDLVVDKIDFALMRPALLVGQMEFRWDRIAAHVLQIAFGDGTLVGEEFGFADIEVKVDRIERNYRCQ